METISRMRASNIIRVCAQKYNVSIEDLKSNKSHRFCTPRYSAMWMIRRLMGMSYPKIGWVMRGRDHSGVMYGIKKIDAQLATVAELRKILSDIQKSLIKS